MSLLFDGGCECPACKGEDVGARIPCRYDDLKPLNDLNHYINVYQNLEGNTDLLRGPYWLYEVSQLIQGARRDRDAKKLEAEAKSKRQADLLKQYAKR